MDKNYYVVMHHTTIYAEDGTCGTWDDAVIPVEKAMGLMRAVKFAREKVEKLHSEIVMNHIRIIGRGDFHITYEMNGDVVSVSFEVVHI